MGQPLHQQPWDAKTAEAALNPQSERTKLVNDLSHAVIGAAVEVQRVLGTGLLESAYSHALAVELTQRGLRFQREVPVYANYKGEDAGVAYRADCVVENALIVELKAQDHLPEAHRAQLPTCQRLSNMRLGLLINFHVFPVVKGICRMVNKLCGWPSRHLFRASAFLASSLRFLRLTPDF